MRLALGIEYDGAAFSGYQKQLHNESVQQTLEQALSRVADHPVRIAAAGRTDAGVHATGQVVSFTSSAQRPLKAWRLGVNALTPAALKVHWVQAVADTFHPRYDATARRYMYLLYESAQPSPLLDQHAVRTPSLDDEAMHRAAQALLGERDFSTFRAAGCQANSPFRRMHRIAVYRAQSIVCIDVTANAFLLRMVRNIVGALREVGTNRRQEDWIAEITEAKDRGACTVTAPAHGLYLVCVSYPGQDFPPAPVPGLLRALGGLDRF